MSQKVRILCTAVFLLLAVSFYAVKLGSPRLVEEMLGRGDLQSLNAMAGTTGERSLDYYLGEIENRVFGPIASVMAGLVLLGVCSLFLSNANGYQFGAAVLFYFLLTRPEVLWNPPFGEGITGPFSDATWLYQNHLDYWGLLHQDTVMKGGPQIYPTSLYTLYLDAVMTVFPSAKPMLIFLHLQTFLMTAAIAVWLREMAAEVFAHRGTATLCAVLFVALPLTQCMAEVLNLEVPCAFFTVWASYLAVRGRMGWATLAALAALFTKDPGIIACAAVFIVALLRVGEEKGAKARNRVILWMALMAVIALTKTVLRAVIIGEQKDYAKVAFLSGWHNIYPSVWLYLYAVCLGIFLVRTWRAWPRDLGVWRGMLHSWRQNVPALTLVLLAGLWFLIFINFLSLAYRYHLQLMPFMIFCVCYILVSIGKDRRVAAGILSGAIIFSFAGSHGLVYRNKGECYPTNLERSLEYRTYLRLEKRLAREVETAYADHSIVAPFQTAQALAIPQLGYVTKQLDVTVYGMRPTLGLKPYVGWGALDLSRTVWIGFPHQYYEHVKLPYPIDPQDRILKKLESGHIEVDIFMGGVAIERMRRVIAAVRPMLK